MVSDEAARPGTVVGRLVTTIPKAAEQRVADRHRSAGCQTGDEAEASYYGGPDTDVEGEIAESRDGALTPVEESSSVGL